VPPSELDEPPQPIARQSATAPPSPILIEGIMTAVYQSPRADVLQPETALLGRQFFRPAGVEAEKIGAFGRCLSTGASFVPSPQLRCGVIPRPPEDRAERF
jgi:hypothetical protein